MRARLLLASWIGLGACHGTSQPTTTAPTPAAPIPACVADGLGPLDPHKTYRTCSGVEDECRAACGRDDVEACFGLALEIEKDPSREKESNELFRKACRLGSPNACTNHAAHLWGFSDKTYDHACAARVFEATCALGDHWACGMSGRILIEGATTPEDEDVARGRAILERSCIAPGGFSCRVLALFWEKGVFGPAPEGRIQELMMQACEGHDENACGEHATVEETFDR
jgi:hypothetical protein